MKNKPCWQLASGQHGKTIILATIFFSLLLCMHCTTHYHPPATKSDDIGQDRINERVNALDNEFGKMYWAGWQNSVRLANALLHDLSIELTGQQRESIQEKLFFSLLFKAIREKHYYLGGENSLQSAEALVKEMNRPDLTDYFRIGQAVFEKGAYIRPLPETLSLSLSEAQTRDYTLYLYSIYYRATDYGDNSRTQPIDLFLQRFPASNLGYFFHKEVEVNEYVQVADDFWELKLSNGHRYYAQGDIDQAWQTFQQILKINPAVPEAICGLARIHYDLDLYQDALNDYCLALEKSPLYFRALFGKAVCLYELRDFQASLTALNTMIDNQLDRSGEACYFRALNFYELGKNKEVEENITLAYSFIPFSLELVLFACRYYYETGQSASFREYLQQGEKIDAASADVLFFKGLFLFQQQERQKALESFFKSLSGYWQRIGHFSAAAEQEQQHSGNDFRFSNQKLRQLKKNRAQTIKEAIRKSKFVKSVYKKATHPLLKSIHALQQQFMTTAKELSQSPEWLTAEE